MDKPQVEQRRLSKGSFERIILTDFWHIRAFVAPQVCASCGAHLGRGDVGQEHKFRAPGPGKAPLGGAWKGYLCTGCAAHGYPVTDFIRFYPNPGDPKELVIEVGSKPLVPAFRQAAKDYINKHSKALVEQANKRLMATSGGMASTIYEEKSYAEVAQKGFFRTDPDKDTRCQEIGSYSKRAGCLSVVLALVGLGALGALAVV